MTKWCSNRSIYNEDKSGILREAKFEFDDKDWAEVNRHADIPDDARRELESSIYLYLVFCLGAGPTAQQNIKNKFKRLTKITDELSRALDDLSRGDRMVLIHMHLGNPILIKHKAAIADLHGWAAQMGQAWGKQRPGPKSSNRDWLIRGAAMIYNGYSKTPFKDFRNREQFIFELLEIAGVDTTQKPSIKLLIRACHRPNWRIFFRRQTVIISRPKKSSNSDKNSIAFFVRYLQVLCIQFKRIGAQTYGQLRTGRPLDPRVLQASPNQRWDVF